SRRRHTRFSRDWSSDVCSSDLFGTLLSQIGITIVNATVINQLAAGQEDRRFRRDVSLAKSDQTVLRVAQSLRRQLVFPEVLLDCVRRGVRVGIDQPQTDAGAGKLLLHPADFGGVTVRDRTIRADEKEDDGFGTGRVEGIEGLAGEIEHSPCGGRSLEVLLSRVVSRISDAAAGHQKRQRQSQYRQ